MKSKNTFKTRSILEINGQKYVYFDLNILANYFSFNLNNIPNSIKILLENLIRNEDGESINHEMISSFCTKIEKKESLANFERPAGGCIEADFLHINTRLKALDEIYKIYKLLHLWAPLRIKKFS